MTALNPHSAALVLCKARVSQAHIFKNTNLILFNRGLYSPPKVYMQVGIHIKTLSLTRYIPEVFIFSL